MACDVLFHTSSTKRKSKWDSPTSLSSSQDSYMYPGDPNQSASSLEAASAAAAKINAMLIAKGKLKLPQAVTSVNSTQPPSDNTNNTPHTSSTTMNKPKVSKGQSYK